MKNFFIGFLAFCLYVASLASIIFSIQFFVPGVARNSQYITESCPNMLTLSTISKNENPVSQHEIALYNCRYWKGHGFYASPTHYISPLRLLTLLCITGIIAYVWWIARRKTPYKTSNKRLFVTVLVELVLISAIAVPLLMNSWDTKEEYLGKNCTAWSAFSSGPQSLDKGVDNNYQHYQGGFDGNLQPNVIHGKRYTGINPTCISLKRIGLISTISIIVVTLTRWIYMFLGITKARRAKSKVSI